MKRPVILLIILLLIGILIHEFIIVDFTLIFLIMLSTYIFYTKNAKNSIIYLIFILLGFYLAFFNTPQIKLDNDILIGKITKAHYFDFSNSYEVKIIKSKNYNHQFNIKLNSKKRFNENDEIKIVGKMGEITGSNNFKTFNNKRYYKSKKIFYQINSEKVFLVKSNSDNIKFKIRKNLSQYLDENLKYSSPLVKSMILGFDYDGEMKEDFQEMGLAHILAISGLHINILISFLSFLGKILKIKRNLFSILIIMILIFYGYIIDFPISILRALIMYIINLIAINTQNVRDDLNNMLFAIFISLLINPFFIYATSFYLSYAAIFSIIYISKQLKRILNINDFFLIPLAIQIGTFPFIIYYFNKINLISILANLIIIPLLSIFLIIAFIFSILHINFIAYILDGIYVFVNTIINGLDIFAEYFTLKYDSPDLLSIVLFFGFLYILFNYRILLLKSKKLKRKSKYFISFIAILFFAIKFFIPHTLINFVDVGQGDCILIRNAGQNFLFDTGGNPLNLKKSGEELHNYLIKNSIKKLDYVFISHNDLDHVGNLYYLVNNIKIDKIFGNYNEKIKMKSVKKGNLLKFKNMEIKVILDGENGESSNDKSLVLFVNNFNYKLLLTGDIEKSENLINIKEKIDFLKIAHHGSKYSTTNEFLNKHNIDNAFISVGKNTYGHPAKETLQRLRKRNIEIYRTDTNGNIEIKIKPYGYFIDYYNKKYKIWELIIKLLFY